MPIATAIRSRSTTLRPLSLVLSLTLGLTLAACTSEDNDQAASDAAGEAASVSGEPFDVAVAGMRGRSYTGQAVLLDSGLAFPDSELEISTRAITLMTSAIDLGQWDDPALEFRDEPALMRLHIRGLVEDHEPGRITVNIEGISPRLTDQDGSSLGTSEQERILNALADHDIVIPEASSSAPLAVVFDIVAGEDEGREALRWTTDHPALQSFDGGDGRRAPL